MDYDTSIILSFVGINFISDLIVINNHMMLSLLSWLAFLVIFISMFTRYPEVFTRAFISEIDKDNPTSFSLLTLVKIVLHMLLFSFNSFGLIIVVYFLEILVFSISILTFFIANKETTLFQIYSRKMNGIKYRFV